MGKIVEITISLKGLTDLKAEKEILFSLEKNIERLKEVGISEEEFILSERRKIEWREELNRRTPEEKLEDKRRMDEMKKGIVYASDEEMAEILNDKELVARIAEADEDIKHGRGLFIG